MKFKYHDISSREFDVRYIVRSIGSLSVTDYNSSCTNLHMEMLPQSSDNTLFDGSSAGATYWDSHFIVAAQTVQIVFEFTRI